MKERFRPTPYAFRHYFSLSDNISKFQTIIEGIEPNKAMPANIDSPESGLDAMAQAMLCTGMCLISVRLWNFKDGWSLKTRSLKFHNRTDILFQSGVSVSTVRK